MSSKESKRSKHDPAVWITVFTDGSGGYFSYEDMVPESLASMHLNDRLMRLINQEYDDFLFKHTR